MPSARGCCSHLRAWGRSFTRTEGLLAILEAALLITLVAFVVFLVLHCFACYSVIETIQNTTVAPTTTKKVFEDVNLLADQECSWTPSAGTEAATRFFEDGRTVLGRTTITSEPPTTEALLEDADEPLEISDGEDADEYTDLVISLVKIKPLNSLTFACTLTIISEHSVVTSASCLEAIEEVDSLDSFVMMEGYGVRRGLTHALSDVLIHPLYQGVNGTYDIAVLKTESKLLRGKRPLELATELDQATVTIGERFLILGFGAFRTISRTPGGLRSVAVHVVPDAHCVAGDRLSERHLAPAGAVTRDACAAAARCAGVLYARGSPCNYCAGTPMVSGGRVFAVMGEPRACGASCEPARFASCSAAWLHSLLSQ